jgi:hypothetical protein
MKKIKKLTQFFVVLMCLLMSGLSFGAEVSSSQTRTSKPQKKYYKRPVRAGDIVFHKQRQRCATVHQQNKDGSFSLQFSPLSDRKFEEVYPTALGTVLGQEFEVSRKKIICKGTVCLGDVVQVDIPHRWINEKNVEISRQPRWVKIEKLFPGGAAVVTLEGDNSGRKYCFSKKELLGKFYAETSSTQRVSLSPKVQLAPARRSLGVQ